MITNASNVVGTTYLYRGGGPCSWDRLHWTGLRRFREFGPVVREDLVPGVSIVHLFSQEDIRKLFLEEGAHPSRRSHTALLHLRSSQPSLYNSGGLLPTNGPQWARNRCATITITGPDNSLSLYLVV